MRSKSFFLAVATAFVIAASALVAFAQVTPGGGKVSLKQADGTSAPVFGAQIDIYRTDIKWEAHVKTDKSGKWMHAGIPLVGTYTLAVSAPGARPSYAIDIRFSRTPNYDFTLEPGDGSKLTLDQIKGLEASSGGNNGGGGSGSVVSAEDKKRAAEAAKAAAEERSKIEEHNKNVQNLNDLVKSGNDAFMAKKYDEAIGFYDQGIQAAPQEPVFYRNKGVVLRTRAVEQYNSALTDKSKREAARESFKASVENMEKAVSFYRESQSKNAGGGGTPPANDELMYLNDRQESYRLALQTSTMVDTEAAVKAFQEYINAETDSAKKMRAQASLGDSLFASGKIDEAIATYRQVLTSNPDNLDAMYGLGIALAAKVVDASKDTELITEAREMLQKFISKAPDTHPRKQEAIASVQYLDETMKGAAASKAADKSSGGSKGGRRKP